MTVLQLVEILTKVRADVSTGGLDPIDKGELTVPANLMLQQVMALLDQAVAVALQAHLNNINHGTRRKNHD